MKKQSKNAYQVKWVCLFGLALTIPDAIVSLPTILEYSLL